MGPSAPKYRKVFSYLETYSEFATRLKAAGAQSWDLTGLSEVQLDEFAWRKFRMQRRILEGTA